jgi:hypothetical protein
MTRERVCGVVLTTISRYEHHPLVWNDVVFGDVLFSQHLLVPGTYLHARSGPGWQRLAARKLSCLQGFRPAKSCSDAWDICIDGNQSRVLDWGATWPQHIPCGTYRHPVQTFHKPESLSLQGVLPSLSSPCTLAAVNTAHCTARWLL